MADKLDERAFASMLQSADPQTTSVDLFGTRLGDPIEGGTPIDMETYANIMEQAKIEETDFPAEDRERFSKAVVKKLRKGDRPGGVVAYVMDEQPVGAERVGARHGSSRGVENILSGMYPFYASDPDTIKIFPLGQPGGSKHPDFWKESIVHEPLHTRVPKSLWRIFKEDIEKGGHYEEHAHPYEKTEEGEFKEWSAYDVDDPLSQLAYDQYSKQMLENLDDEQLLELYKQAGIETKE
jgi:hypothetical protein